MGLSKADREKRTSGLGASEMSAVLEMNPWTTGMDVWLEKTGKVEPRPDSMQSRVGHMNEQTAAELYVEELKVDEGMVFVSSPTLQAKDQEIALATPDRFLCTQLGAEVAGLDGEHLVSPKGFRNHQTFEVFASQVELLLECKNVGHRVLPHWRSAENSAEYAMPDYVAIQIMWQMRVCPGIEIGDCAALLGGTDFRSFRILRDQDTLDEMSEYAELWWHRHVVADTPPPVDGGSAWKNYVHRRFPEAKKKIMLPAEAGTSNLAALHIAGKLAEKQAEESYKALETEIKETIGDNTGMTGVLPNGKRWQVTWKADKSGRRSWKDIAGELAAFTDLEDDALLSIIANNTQDPERKFSLKELK